MHSCVNIGLVLTGLLSIHLPVSGDPNPQGFSRPEQEILTKYLLRRLLGKDDLDFPGEGGEATDRADRSDQLSSSSIIYPQVSSQNLQKPLRILLDQAKENIDVIDFRKNRREQYYEGLVRNPRQPQIDPEEIRERERSSASSEAIPTFLPFPGTEPPSKPSRKQNKCADCHGDGATASRFSMPLTQLGQKKYYLGIFFKANWYKAEQYCRFHGMHLASINKEQEQNDLENHIESFGMGHEHFWTSGTDQGEEGKFFWMSTGKPVTYENWNAGEPNNFRYENGEEEHCMELWNRDGKGLRWNDTPCSFETFFVCEV